MSGADAATVRLVRALLGEETLKEVLEPRVARLGRAIEAIADEPDENARLALMRLLSQVMDISMSTLRERLRKEVARRGSAPAE